MLSKKSAPSFFFLLAATAAAQAPPDKLAFVMSAVRELANIADVGTCSR